MININMQDWESSFGLYLLGCVELHKVCVILMYCPPPSHGLNLNDRVRLPLLEKCMIFQCESNEPELHCYQFFPVPSICFRYLILMLILKRVIYGAFRLSVSAIKCLCLSAQCLPSRLSRVPLHARLTAPCSRKLLYACDSYQGVQCMNTNQNDVISIGYYYYYNGKPFKG